MEARSSWSAKKKVAPKEGEEPLALSGGERKDIWHSRGWGASGAKGIAASKNGDNAREVLPKKKRTHVLSCRARKKKLLKVETSGRKKVLDLGSGKRSFQLRTRINLLCWLGGWGGRVGGVSGQEGVGGGREGGGVASG